MCRDVEPRDGPEDWSVFVQEDVRIPMDHRAEDSIAPPLYKEKLVHIRELLMSSIS